MADLQMIMNPWTAESARAPMSLRAAWIWFGAWLSGLVLSTCLFLATPAWTLRTVLVLLLLAIQLPVGIGLVQYAIWSNRRRLGKMWSLFLLIPPALAAQSLWIPIVLIFDSMIRTGTPE